MISSRKLEDLHPVVQAKAIAHKNACAEEGIDLLIYCTFRDNESQAALYAQGRTKPGDIVTDAKPGYSFHNFRCAYDCVPLRDGKPVWGNKTDPDRKLWERVGQLGESCGLEWAGRWTGSLRETAHFQFAGGLTTADFRAGRTF